MTAAPLPAPAGATRLQGLRIERIETIAVRVPLSRRYIGSAYHMDNRCTIITRLHTTDGLVSAVYNGDTDAEQEIIVGIIYQELAPQLIGRSAADPEGCWIAMEPATNDILRDRSLAVQAIACLDTAIWDVFGKALEQPLYRLWGAYTDRLPISVIGGYYQLDDVALIDLMKRYAAMGFAGCKLKVGGKSPREDAKRVATTREAVGDGFALMVDANQGYTREEAVEFGRRVRDLDIRWFEEPCRWTNDRRWMRDVRLQTGIPVAAGQSECTLAGLRDLIADGAIDVSNFDASWSGGPTVWRKAAGLAAAFGVELGHHEEPQISGHLLASVPNGTFIECFDEDRDPLFWNIQVSRPLIEGGRTQCRVAPDSDSSSTGNTSIATLCIVERPTQRDANDEAAVGGRRRGLLGDFRAPAELRPTRGRDRAVHRQPPRGGSRRGCPRTFRVRACDDRLARCHCSAPRHRAGCQPTEPALRACQGCARGGRPMGLHHRPDRLRSAGPAGSGFAAA